MEIQLNGRPVLRKLDDGLILCRSHLRAPYAWYIRVPGLQKFLRLIAPVFEQRVAESPIVGYTGTTTTRRACC